MENWIVIILAIIGIAVVLTGIGWYIHRRNNPKPAKRKDRDNKNGRAVSAAKSFARKNSFRVIAPANLARKGRFANLDAIVIGYFGILGVKAIGYNGEIYGTAQDDEWLQLSEDESRNYFPNPIIEAAADVRVIRDALFEVKLRNIPVEVVVVFTEPSAQIAVPAKTGHFTMKSFKSYLGKEKFLDDKGHDLDKVENAIKAALVAE